MAISEGTMVEGIHCVPDLVELMPKQHDIPRAWLRIVVLFQSFLSFKVLCCYRF